MSNVISSEEPVPPVINGVSSHSRSLTVRRRHCADGIVKTTVSKKEVSMKKVAIVLAVLTAVVIFPYQARADILGYPWSTWGELAFSPSNDIEKGVKLDMYAEQGIDWATLGGSDWVLNNFVGFGLVVSDHRDDFWNNRARPAIGMKIKHPVKTSINNWGELAIGIRGEYFGYFHKSDESALRGVAFLQWSVGGDWKNRR
jgi:hypothetical protein